MKLTDEERSIALGSHGSTPSLALERQTALGDFFGAEDFVPITNAHFTGDFEVMGQGGERFLESLARDGARVIVPTTRNSRCVDPVHAEHLRQSPTLLAGEARVSALLARMGVLGVNTCVGYQTVYQPHLREHVAWSDTGAVAYANSVLGARTNFEAGPFSLFAALTGRTPRFGYHLDSVRRANVVCRLRGRMGDVADWGALGLLLGERYRGYWNVPVIEAASAAPSPDDLKHFAASLASYGSMAMFHFVGVTPEAPSTESAVAERDVVARTDITLEEIDRVFARFRPEGGKISLVVFTAPQLSLFEMKRLVDLFGARTVHPDVCAIITTNAQTLAAARSVGVLRPLQEAGLMVLEGTCWYLMDPAEMRRAFGWSHVVTNSAKLANIIRGSGYEPIFRRTGDCVAAAVSAEVGTA